MAIVNRKQLAVTLGVSERWVIQLRTDGVLQSTDESGHYFDKEAAIDAFEEWGREAHLRSATRKSQDKLTKLIRQIRALSDEEREKVKSELDKGLESSVYFLRSGKFVKIGYSTNPDERFRQHAVSNPDLETLAIVPGTRSTEKELHRKFSHLHHDREWFHLNEEILAEIKRLAETSAVGAELPG